MTPKPEEREIEEAIKGVEIVIGLYKMSLRRAEAAGEDVTQKAVARNIKHFETLIQAAQSPQGCGMTRDELIDTVLVNAYGKIGTSSAEVAVDAFIAANLLTVKGE